MEGLIECVAKALVDSPDDVRVEAVKGEGVTVYELHVAEPDLGKVIGKSGRTAEALRTILHAASIKMGMRSRLEIVD